MAATGFALGLLVTVSRLETPRSRIPLDAFHGVLTQSKEEARTGTGKEPSAAQQNVPLPEFIQKRERGWGSSPQQVDS